MRFLSKLLLMDNHICPWWLAYTFDNPLRRILHPPEKVLSGLVSRGQTVLDIGCGMGHFTLGMARMVGEQGRVIAVDLQAKMLDRVRRRAEKQRLRQRIVLHEGEVAGLDMRGEVDFALAFWMVHEVPEKASFFKAVRGLLKPTGRFLVAEPKIHTSKADLNQSVKVASEAGLHIVSEPRISFSRCALFTPSDGTSS